MKGVKVEGAMFLFSSVSCHLGPKAVLVCSTSQTHEISFFSFCPHPNSGGSNPGQVLCWGEAPHCPLPSEPTQQRSEEQF